MDKKQNIRPGALKGSAAKGTPIEGSVFRVDDAITASAFVPVDVASMSSLYSKLAYRPSKAVLAAPFIACVYGLYTEDVLTHVIMGKEIHEIALYDIEDKNIFYTGNVGDEALLIPPFVAELQKKKELYKEWREVDLSKAYDDDHKNCFVEQDQKKAFGKVSSGMLYASMEGFKTFVPYKLGKRGEVTDKDVDSIFKGLQADRIIDLTGLLYTDEYPDVVLQRMGLEPEMRKIMPILRRDIEEFDLGPIAPKKVKKDIRADFFATDWSMMTDEEAERLPEDLQASRDLCRKKYEEGKNYLTNKQLTWIKRFYKGTARSMLFLGDAGTGKTTTAQMIAGCLHLPMEHVIGDAESGADEYFGGYVLTADDEGNSKMIWADGPVTRAMRTGSLLLFDEVNICRPSVLASFHSILDGIRGITLKQKGEFVRANPNFLFVGTMNAGEGYEGTNKLNNAFVSRMDVNTKFSPFSHEKAIDILKEETGYSNLVILEKLMQVHDYIKDNIQDPMDQFTSIRQVISWIRQAEVTEEWIESSVDTILAPLLMNADEDVAYEVDDILESDTLAGETLSIIKELLEGDEY